MRYPRLSLIKVLASLAFLAAWSLIFTLPCRADGDLTLLYIEHPAYHTAHGAAGGNGDVSGIVADPVKLALKRAGIDYHWREIPIARQRYIVGETEEQACIVGALKNPEREKTGKFSHPIYQGKPIVAVSRADNAAMRDGAPLAATLSNSHLTLLSKIGYSFGPFVDGSVDQLKPKVETTTAELPNMLKMLLVNRADYFFMSEDAYDGLVRGSGFELRQFKLSHFSDMPAGNLRYLWCSNSVPENWLARFNTQIDKLFVKA
jgi:polar amino acid transport system substrate-binding protein